jgi:SAM-dependent methyltransferase
MDAAAHFRAEAEAGGKQRRWPNEEFARFMGRHFFGRGPARILELGCGSGANLRLIADEGFEAWGIDLEPLYVRVCEAFLKAKGLQATLHVANMADTGLPDRHFDAVADVFSAYCLDDAGHHRMLGEVARLLKPGGRFFAFTPSRASAAIARELFAENSYPWRFTTAQEYAADLAQCGFSEIRAGTLKRPDNMEFVVVEARQA